MRLEAYGVWVEVMVSSSWSSRLHPRRPKPGESSACVTSHQRAYTKVVEDLQSITRRFREPLKQDLAFVFDCYRHTRQSGRDLGYSSLTCDQLWSGVESRENESRGAKRWSSENRDIPVFTRNACKRATGFSGESQLPQYVS